MSDVLVYATESRADIVRSTLGQACAATGLSAQLELYGSGSLYQRLGHGHTPPPPDLVLWFGAFAARAAAIDGLLQAYKPTTVADGVVHDPDWKWTALDYSPVGVVGASALSGWQDLASVPKLAMADPERSEVGLAIVLASLDAARLQSGDAETAWAWWQTRARSGLALAEDDAGALALVQTGAATHALTLSDTGVALPDLAPIAHAVGLTANARNLDAARRLVDWLTSESASSALPGSPWRLASNAMVLDVDWARQQYASARRRWAQSGFGPTLQA